MKTKTFKNLEEIELYYQWKTNTYDFTEFDLVVFKFDLCVDSNINANDIIAVDIVVWDIDAYDITANNIKAWNIQANDIKTNDINATDIKATDINASDISYYAVCIAYKNIKCKSIEGRRPNSKHFVLDGKIELLENENKNI